MCGIVGVCGQGNGVPKVVAGLEKSLYRGYDSVGIAVLTPSGIEVRKDVGKVQDVEQKAGLSALEGNVAIGHNRWATTGKVSKENAHPHLDCTGKIAVVHNGIIENFETLKAALIAEGHTFASETDTEVIAHLIEKHAAAGFTGACRAAFALLTGRNAFVALHAGSPILVGARRGSPLIVGIGHGETFIASDVPAFLEQTRDVMYLDDDEMVVIGDRPVFSTPDGRPVEKRVVTIDIDPAQAEKGSYPYFLIKEIMEQKDTISRAINQPDQELLAIADRINRAYGTFFTGCGTAGKVCMAAEYLFSAIAKKHVNYVVSSEFPSYREFLTPKTLVVAISQSGETADLLDAVEAAKKQGAAIFSLVNVEGSSLNRLSDWSFLINAGPEKAVASTKATTSQLALVTLLAYACAGRLAEGKRLLLDVEEQINDLLNPRYEAHIKKLAIQLKTAKSIYLIGRGANYPVALEGAIKIMEVARIHAQGFAGGELKHGPLALIFDRTPCIVFVANDATRDHILSNAMEVKARGGRIIGVSPQNNPVFDDWIRVPDAGDASPIVNIIPIQLLAYYLGILQGFDPDYCANLSKSITVR
ncbi:MAG: glutamine--fructose-6-phosphate transaminase (isomerizing) [Candidatus Aenigmarchaeota archaeon]|nr:glutamine--fructose-6-phosphate transaminase (isomerizing) [Candidatus Aenigmarchaeota archaeon]